MVVMVILALLIALLLPAISAAMRTARNASVSAEINQLAQALAAFKTKYGDYPPSRILLAENGNYTQWLNGGVNGSTPIAPNDITYAQLAQRSVTALRKFFPRVPISTTGPVPTVSNAYFYDFNGNGTPDGWYILNGHECLVFFLGGIPQQTSSGLAVSGFGKDPANPFSNNTTGFAMYNGNRQPPMFEFVADRLKLDPNDASLIPGYLDTTGNQLGGGLINFYAYFSAYGNGAYDPNDVNFSGTLLQEQDANGSVAGLTYHVTFATSGACVSPAPNPYTSTGAAPFNGPPNNPISVTATFLNPQSFQIISAGLDGQYGVGSQYLPSSNSQSLPFDPSANFANAIYLPYVSTLDAGIRTRERDNVTNFHNGKLE
jgi:general secretion pathway protein G